MDIKELKNQALKEISKLKNSQDLEEIRIKYFGRKQGLLREISDSLPSLNLEERKALGQELNSIKKELLGALEQAQKSLSIPESTTEWFDITAPSVKPSFGSTHPITKTTQEIKEIFHYLGFSFVDGPEVELDLYNFQKLRISKDHPARDLQQTYYLNENLVLRTHTSSMQVRYMETHKPPIRVLFPGRVYRRDQIDSTHLPSFHQIEGLLVDKQASLSNLIGVLNLVTKRLFGEDSKIRIYGHHFPYTEPSIEIEVYYPKTKRWLEILGAGMVHPEVLENGKIDSKIYRGWAFGMGADRIAMIKYGIDDIRPLYSGDLRFLKQF